MTMSKGEKAELTIEPEWAYGKKGNIDAKYPLFIEAKNSAFVCRSWICCSRIYLYHSYGEFLVGTPCSSGQQQFHVAQELWSFLFIMQFECVGIPIQTLLDPARHCVTFSLKKVSVPFLVVPKNIQTPLMDDLLGVGVNSSWNHTIAVYAVLSIQCNLRWILFHKFNFSRCLVDTVSLCFGC